MMFISKKNQYFKKNKVYKLLINDQKNEIFLKRITDLKDIYLNFIYSKKMLSYEGYFIYKQNSFSTFFFKSNIDLIFVNNDGFVVDYYSNFKPNKVTKQNKNIKYIYILPQNTINNLFIKIDETTRFFHKKTKINNFYNKILIDLK